MQDDDTAKNILFAEINVVVICTGGICYPLAKGNNCKSFDMASIEWTCTLLEYLIWMVLYVIEIMAKVRLLTPQLPVYITSDLYTVTPSVMSSMISGCRPVAV